MNLLIGSDLVLLRQPGLTPLAAAIYYKKPKLARVLLTEGANGSAVSLLSSYSTAFPLNRFGLNCMSSVL
jgi:hypothetical protein